MRHVAIENLIFTRNIEVEKNCNNEFEKIDSRSRTIKNVKKSVRNRKVWRAIVAFLRDMIPK